MLLTEIDLLREEKKKLKAEINRKDVALKRVVGAFTLEVVHMGSRYNNYKAAFPVDIYDPIKQARDALSEAQE